jgi:hypothetical protein
LVLVETTDLVVRRAAVSKRFNTIFNSSSAHDTIALCSACDIRITSKGSTMSNVMKETETQHDAEHAYQQRVETAEVAVKATATAVSDYLQQKFQFKFVDDGAPRDWWHRDH